VKQRRGPAAGAKRRSGFTIMEVVLAMFILLMGMTTIIGLLSFGAATARTAELRAASANSAPAIIADLEENLFPLVLENGQEVAGEPRVIVDRPVPGHPRLTYSAAAVPVPDAGTGSGDDPRLGVPLEYRVEVEVSWKSAGTLRSRKFTTLLLREVPFGERLRLKFVENFEPKPAADIEASSASSGTRRETTR
jgi:hypothetical protein